MKLIIIGLLLALAFGQADEKATAVKMSSSGAILKPFDAKKLTPTQLAKLTVARDAHEKAKAELVSVERAIKAAYGQHFNTTTMRLSVLVCTRTVVTLRGEWALIKEQPTGECGVFYLEPEKLQ